MASFGNTSKYRMAGVHGDLVHLMCKVVEGYDCTINYNGGYRDRDTQNELYPTFSKVSWPNSYHNCEWLDPHLHMWMPCSLAVDAMPYYKMEPHVDWNDKGGFYHFAGYVRAMADELETPVVWGGDWDGDYDLDDQNFYDLAHFQLDIHRNDDYMKIWTDHIAHNG